MKSARGGGGVAVDPCGNTTSRISCRVGSLLTCKEQRLRLVRGYLCVKLLLICYEVESGLSVALSAVRTHHGSDPRLPTCLKSSRGQMKVLLILLYLVGLLLLLLLLLAIVSKPAHHHAVVGSASCR
jgi:hypothetical protein